MSETLIFPQPDWTADEYVCEHGHVTQRYQLPTEPPWNGVVRCSTCGSEKTKLSARGVPARVNPHPLAPQRQLCVFGIQNGGARAGELAVMAAGSGVGVSRVIPTYSDAIKELMK